MISIPRELRDDAGRLVTDWVVPVVRKNLARNEELIGVHASVELQVDTGDGKLVWHVEITGGTVEAASGPSDKPDVILKAHLDDGLALLEGDLDGEAALVDGRLRVSGDVALATQIAPLLRGTP